VSDLSKWACLRSLGLRVESCSE